MEKPIKPGRITALACMLTLLVIVFVVALYKLQIVDGKAYYEENRNSVASSLFHQRKQLARQFIDSVAAARGSILDRYGRVLVSNTSCNNLVFNPDDLFEQDDPNGILLRLARTVVSCGDTYVDELPVTTAPPFEYTDMSETQRTQLKGFLKYAGLDEEATAVELLSYCREKFEINNNYSAADMRTIAGLRYSIKTRYIDKLYLPDYVFVKDASMELITSLKENNVPGFEVTVSYTRQYHTNLAAHLLGYTGLMNAEEYTTYKTQGYPMSATVGKDGAELAFEKYLHGTDGTAIVTKNAAGTVTGTTYTKEPEPGNQVSLTIDLDLQSAAEQSLTKGIENMKSKSTENSDAVGGGALVVDVATGQPLAIANYPTFDLQTLFQSEENYKAVSEADNQPLFNRALLGQYSPGSTFKPCTAIAGLTEGIITTGTTIQCTGTFRKYEDTGYAPKCWIASSGTTHGNDNVTEAIRDSCNIFFYTVGDSLPIDTLARYAAAFGLGEHTGIELPESTGQMATEAVKKKLENTNWYVGDSLQAAIGQSYSLFTPLQLANYVATLVGGGEQQRTPHLLRQGLWLSSLLSLVLMGVFAFLSLHLELFGLDAELAPLAAGYLRAMLFGLPGMMLFVNVRGFLEGYARTRPAMLVGLLGLALNVPCNYVLIYGKLGLPQLGAVGCGVATALCYWFMAACMIYYVRRDAQYRDLHPLFLPLLLPRTAGEGGEARRVDWPLVWRIFRIGLPGALAACFEASLFAVTALLLAPLGKVVVAGHQIAMNFSSIVYMLPLSLNITVAIRVGQNLGAGRLERARLSARTALCLGLGLALLTMTSTLCLRPQIAQIYNSDPAVLGLAVGLLVFAAVNQIPESLQTVSIGVLRAYNDTRYILGVCLFSYWIVGLGTGWTLARTDWLVPAMGATGFWIGYGLALWVSFSLYRLRMGRLHRLDAEAVRQRIRR